MALTNIVPGERVEIESFAHQYNSIKSPGAGFSFDCDRNGVVNIKDMSPGAMVNFARCLFGLEPVTYNGIADYSHSYWQPAYGTCACGRMVELDHDDGHGIDCECGRIYSGSGSELRPRSQWEDRYDEDSTQPYAIEFGMAGQDW